MLPLPPTLEQVQQLQSQLLQALNSGAAKLKNVLPADALIAILRAAEAVLRNEPSMVELSVEEGAQVFVFGDTHGHFPDVAYMLDQLGYPSASRIYIFNGDYVDRGSWGVELLAILCALKVAAPKWVYLLRGNHESSTCTKYYGYSQEVRAKYEKHAKDVYAASKKLFTALPLAALVQNSTLIMHGGLFRRPPEPKRGAKRRKSIHPSRAGANAASALVPGTLDDLRKATKGGMDPDGSGTSLLATDVLWSDPVGAAGFAENDARGVGLTFGPDITEAFLAANGLRLIIRSHEGPDARDKRDDLPQVLQGYSVDHDTPAGKLMTVFSAPDYPQFQAVEGTEEGGPGKRYENLAAVAVLSAPDYATPEMRTFEAVRPRPKADAYYDYAVYCDSDTEVPGAGETTTTTTITGDGGGASEAASELVLDMDEEEVVGPSALQPEQEEEVVAAAAPVVPVPKPTIALSPDAGPGATLLTPTAARQGGGSGDMLTPVAPPQGAAGAGPASSPAAPNAPRSEGLVAEVLLAAGPAGAAVSTGVGAGVEAGPQQDQGTAAAGAETVSGTPLVLGALSPACAMEVERNSPAEAMQPVGKEEASGGGEAGASGPPQLRGQDKEEEAAGEVPNSVGALIAGAAAGPDPMCCSGLGGGGAGPSAASSSAVPASGGDGGGAGGGPEDGAGSGGPTWGGCSGAGIGAGEAKAGTGEGAGPGVKLPARVSADGGSMDVDQQGRDGS